MNFISNRILTLDDIRKTAPSVFADHPKSGVSERYAFIPTTRVLDTLTNEGWLPVKAEQSRAKTPDGKDFAKHILRFRRESEMNREAMKVGDSVPELVLTNSHNGTSAFEFFLGLFRLACSNGLIVMDGQFERHSVRHVGFTDAKVIDVTNSIVSNVPQVIDRMHSFRQVQLTNDEQRAFADSALTLRYEQGTAPIKPESLLQVRRFEDQRADLWTTFNRVQENMLRGGLAGRAASGRRTRTREVKSVNENVRLNQALWQLAESMRQLKTQQAA